MWRVLHRSETIRDEKRTLDEMASASSIQGSFFVLKYIIVLISSDIQMIPGIQNKSRGMAHPLM